VREKACYALVLNEGALALDDGDTLWMTEDFFTVPDSLPN
jgi:hypothetical protein